MHNCFFCRQQIINAVAAGKSNEEMQPTYVCVPEELQMAYDALPTYYQLLRHTPPPAYPQSQNQEELDGEILTPDKAETAVEVVAHATCLSSAVWSATQYQIDKSRVQHLEQVQAEFRNYFFLSSERQLEIRDSVKAGGYKSLLTDLITLKQRTTV